jgi:hypothetical protein
VAQEPWRMARETWRGASHAQDLMILVLLLLLPAVAPAQTTKPDRVDDAVSSALAFLQKTQDANGAWATQGSASPAATGLAVLAFLSAGHVPGEGRYGGTVDKGVRWVLTRQQASGLFTCPPGQDMYHLGICTLMLAEVTGMMDAAQAPRVKSALEKAVAYLLKAQRTTGPARGGWRYFLNGNDADLSVTGWQLLALRAARNVGCDVPAERIDLAVAFVLRCRDAQSGGFGYLPGSWASTSCTGTGILCLEICGKERHRSPEVLRAASFLNRQPPRAGGPHFFYTTYYCSQAMFQVGGTYWDFFRPQLHKVVLDSQQANGCWLFGDSFGPDYATAMAVLALTVEHRLLPIYQRGEEPPRAK